MVRYGHSRSRAAETWTKLYDGSGTHPEVDGLIANGIALDEARDRILLYGDGFATDLRGDLWAFSFSENTWSKILATGAPGPIVHGALVVPPGNSAYLVGGRSWDRTRREMTGPGDRVYEISLAPGAESFSLLDEVLPQETLGGSLAWDRTSVSSWSAGRTPSRPGPWTVCLRST